MSINAIFYQKLKNANLLGLVSFEDRAISDIQEWCDENNDDILNWIIDLLLDININGDTNGIGRPEKLFHELHGWYSRTITYRHRLVYKIDNNIIKVLMCKGHY